MSTPLGSRLRGRVLQTYRSLSYALMEKLEGCLSWACLFWQVRLGLLEVYQPIYSRRWGVEDSALRGCEDRLRAFTAKLPGGPISVLDFGCNIGFFVFSLAERGGACVGIDAGRKEVIAAKALRLSANRKTLRFYR